MDMNFWVRHGTSCRDAKMNLLCFPYAGGSSGIFAGWAGEFREEINLCPVLYPGRDIRMDEAVPGDIERAAREFVEDNRQLFEMPFAVLGYCAGGLYAYESILCIRELYGKTPEFFVPISFATPSFRMKLNEICATTDDRELIRYLVENALVDEETSKNKDFLEYYLPIIRGDLHAVENYRYGKKEKLECEIYAFFGRDDSMFASDDKSSWNSYTEDACVIEDLRGGHYCLEENRKYLIEFIKKKMRESMR